MPMTTQGACAFHALDFAWVCRCVSPKLGFPGLSWILGLAKAPATSDYPRTGFTGSCRDFTGYFAGFTGSCTGSFTGSTGSCTGSLGLLLVSLVRLQRCSEGLGRGPIVCSGVARSRIVFTCSFNGFTGSCTGFSGSCAGFAGSCIGFTGSCFGVGAWLSWILGLANGPTPKEYRYMGGVKVKPELCYRWAHFREALK